MMRLLFAAFALVAIRLVAEVDAARVVERDAARSSGIARAAWSRRRLQADGAAGKHDVERHDGNTSDRWAEGDDLVVGKEFSEVNLVSRVDGEDDDKIQPRRLVEMGPGGRLAAIEAMIPGPSPAESPGPSPAQSPAESPAESPANSPAGSWQLGFLQEVQIEEANAEHEDMLEELAQSHYGDGPTAASFYGDWMGVSDPFYGYGLALAEMKDDGGDEPAGDEAAQAPDAEAPTPAPMDSTANRTWAQEFAMEVQSEQGEGAQAVRVGGPTPPTTGRVYSSLSTYFFNIGVPFSGCGVPRDVIVDDNGKPLPFVALNLAKGDFGYDPEFPIPDGNNGAFNMGEHCGRWVEIRLGENCVNGQNDDNGACFGEDARYESDKFTGEVIYGYVADSCDDANFWCRTDEHHLDISFDYLKSIGAVEGGVPWNGRKLDWAFISRPPPGWTQDEGPKFMWREGARFLSNGNFWAPLIIYNLDNGISSIQQKVMFDGKEEWVDIFPDKWLGQQFPLGKPGEYPEDGQVKFTIRIFDHSDDMYGTYEIPLECDGMCDETFTVKGVQEL